MAEIKCPACGQQHMKATQYATGAIYYSCKNLDCPSIGLGYARQELIDQGALTE